MDTEIIVAIITGGLALLGVMFPIVYDNYRKKRDGDLITKYKFPKLIENPIHHNIDIYIRDARNFNDNNLSEGRNELASDFMVFSLESWREPCRKFSEEVQRCIDSCTIDCDLCNQMYTFAMDLFSSGMKYESLAGFHMTPEDEQVVKLFRDKYIEVNHSRIERLTRKIADIALINDVYKDCSFKSARILEAIDDYLYDVIRDGAEAIRSVSFPQDSMYKGKTLC